MATQSKSQQAPLHFRRLELKYLLPERLMHTFLDRIAPYTNIDPYLTSSSSRSDRYPVTSLYFDSFDLQSLHEKESGLLSRRKVRLRTYANEFSPRRQCFLEIKRRHDVVVSKDRLSLPVKSVDLSLPFSQLLPHLLQRTDASEEVSTEAELLTGWYNLQPTALVQYERIPRVAKQDSRFRITVDRGLRGVWRPVGLLGGHVYHSCYDNAAVLEVKCNHSLPAWFHDILQDFELCRVAHSKYTAVVMAIRSQMFTA